MLSSNSCCLYNLKCWLQPPWLRLLEVDLSQKLVNYEDENEDSVLIEDPNKLGAKYVKVLDNLANHNDVV